MQLRQPNRGRRAGPVTISAPTGGLNVRDSFTEMPVKDAFQMDNWFPDSTSVDTRGGSLTFGTGFPAAVESLEVYTGATSKMLAFSNGNVYDATAGGAVGAAIKTGMTSSKMTSTMFSNAGNQFLLLYNGVDQPMYYDGTTLSLATITGMTGSQNTLHSPIGFKGRVYLAQVGMLGFYYLAVGAIQGAASYFDLGQQSTKGGTLTAIASFSVQDSGVGPGDYMVFATSEGEYILYAGTDPSNAANWNIVGRYYGPAPIGRKSWFKFRSDIYFITEEGVVSFTEIRQMGDDNENANYLTSKLGRALTDATTAYSTAHGWCGMIYPRGHYLIVNVPNGAAETAGYTQYAMNTNTNAWTHFVGWSAVSWALFRRRAYFGTADGRVVLADEGFMDDSTEISAVCRQAWNTFDDQNGMGMADKQFHIATFALACDGQPALSFALNVNYQNDQPTYATSVAAGVGAAWDVAAWDVAAWAGGATTQSVSIAIGKLGYIASPWVQAVSRASKVRWFATRLILEKTQGVLLQ